MDRAVCRTHHQRAAWRGHGPALPCAPVGPVVSAHPHSLRPRFVTAEVPRLRQTGAAQGDGLVCALRYAIDGEVTAVRGSTAVPEFVLGDGVVVGVQGGERQ